jgi:hypothetical protein
MVFTDPPYNVNYANSAKDKVRGKNRPIRDAVITRLEALTVADVLRVSDTDIMRITGDAGDDVLITDTLTRGADITLDSTDFATFTASTATLYIQLGWI